MPLPWTEIRDKAIAFSRDWQNAKSERAEAQTFWNEFFAVFGVPRRRVASFEEPVKKLGAKRGRIDAFWKGQAVVEHQPTATKKPYKSVPYMARPLGLQTTQKTCSMKALRRIAETVC